MIRISTWFKFTPLGDWGETKERGRLTYRSPKGEVLIISTSNVSGVGSSTELENIRSRILETTLASVNKAAQKPDLRIVKSLTQDERVLKIECWTVEAESLDGVEIFFQSVFRNELGILLATFEAYNSSESKTLYENFIKSVEKNGLGKV
jgi:hypothetical protein